MGLLWVSESRTTSVGAASGREGVGSVTAALSPYQTSPCPPPARRCRAEFRRIWLYLFVRPRQLGLVTLNNFNLKRGILEIPTPAQRWTPDPLPHLVQNGGDIYLVPSSPQAVTLLEQTHKRTGKFDLVFAGDAKPWKPMSENTVKAALRTMGYDAKVDICGHGFRSMACSALIESGLWLETAIERQMSHTERNNIRAAHTRKAESLKSAG